MKPIQSVYSFIFYSYFSGVNKEHLELWYLYTIEGMQSSYFLLQFEYPFSLSLSLSLFHIILRIFTQLKSLSKLSHEL